MLPATQTDKEERLLYPLGRGRTVGAGATACMNILLPSLAQPDGLLAREGASSAQRKTSRRELQLEASKLARHGAGATRTTQQPHLRGGKCMSASGRRRLTACSPLRHLGRKLW